MINRKRSSGAHGAGLRGAEVQGAASRGAVWRRAAWRVAAVVLAAVVLALSSASSAEAQDAAAKLTVAQLRAQVTRRQESLEKRVKRLEKRFADLAEEAKEIDDQKKSADTFDEKAALERRVEAFAAATKAAEDERDDVEAEVKALEKAAKNPKLASRASGIKLPKITAPKLPAVVSNVVNGAKKNIDNAVKGAQTVAKNASKAVQQGATQAARVTTDAAKKTGKAITETANNAGKGLAAAASGPVIEKAIEAILGTLGPLGEPFKKLNFVSFLKSMAKMIGPIKEPLLSIAQCAMLTGPAAPFGLAFDATLFVTEALSKKGKGGLFEAFAKHAGSMLNAFPEVFKLVERKLKGKFTPEALIELVYEVVEKFKNLPGPPSKALACIHAIMTPLKPLAMQVIPAVMKFAAEKADWFWNTQIMPTLTGLVADAMTDEINKVLGERGRALVQGVLAFDINNPLEQKELAAALNQIGVKATPAEAKAFVDRAREGSAKVEAILKKYRFKPLQTVVKLVAELVRAAGGKVIDEHVSPVVEKGVNLLSTVVTALQGGIDSLCGLIPEAGTAICNVLLTQALRNVWDWFGSTKVRETIMTQVHKLFGGVVDGLRDNVVKAVDDSGADAQIEKLVGVSRGALSAASQTADDVSNAGNLAGFLTQKIDQLIARVKIVPDEAVNRSVHDILKRITGRIITNLVNNKEANLKDSMKSAIEYKAAVRDLVKGLPQAAAAH